MNDGGDIRQRVFALRSYTPIPFLVAMVVFARPTLASLVGGGAVVLAGEAIRLWGVSIVGAETRTTGSVGGTYLVTSGPFALVRNPLYFGNMMIYAGIGIMSMALFPWLPLVALVWFAIQYHLIVTREEEYLAERFGAAYAEYRAAVRRFLPRITPYRSTAPSPKRLNLAEGLASERRTLQAVVLVVGALIILYVIRA
jgi:protein-S-isoprenylcysteine O-methyltransferase Ste14